MTGANNRGYRTDLRAVSSTGFGVEAKFRRRHPVNLGYALPVKRIATATRVGVDHNDEMGVQTSIG
ncbi:hypothetical protein [Mycobacterium sp. ZZG]